MSNYIELTIIEYFEETYKNCIIHCPCCGQVVYNITAIAALFNLQKYFKNKFFITSYYRCPARNKTVGGHTASLHLQGRAFDIVVKNLTEINFFIEKAKQCGFSTIIYYEDRKFWHLDNQIRAVYTAITKKNQK